jgi:hypothetical protein
MTVPDPNRVQVLIDSILPMDELVERGYTLAKLSGTIKRLSDDEQSLEEYAVAIAGDTHADAYDAAANHQDKLREEEYQSLVQRRDDAYIAKGYADEVGSKREDQLAELESESKNKPNSTVWVPITATLVLGASIATTLHDRIFFNVTDQLIAWSASGAIAVVVGVFVSWSLLGSVATSGQRTALNKGGLVAGILLSIGTAVLRVAEAHEFAENVFAGALTLIEISTVLALDWLGSGLRSDFQAWGKYFSEKVKRSALLETAKSDSRRRQQQIDEIAAAMLAHRQYIELRWIKHHKVKDIEIAAVKAILSGYHKGVAENRGRQLGVLVKIA